MSPTQRSLKYLRESGWTAHLVAHWNGFAKRRMDLMCADIFAFRHGVVLLANATDSSSVSKREAKARLHPDVQLWLKQGSGFQFAVIGWRKGVKGEQALIWREVK